MIEGISKAIDNVFKSVLSGVSGFVFVGGGLDQPRNIRGNQLSEVQLREMALKSDTVAACVDAIVTYCGRCELSIVPRRGTGSVPIKGRVAMINSLLDDPNPNQESFREMLLKVIRDLVILDKSAIEIVRDDLGNIRELWAVDAATIGAVTDEHGKEIGFTGYDAFNKPIPNPKTNQLPTWDTKDIIYIKTSPTTSNPYGWSKLSTAYATAMIEMHALNYIGKRFTEGRIPFGILDLGKVNKTQMDEAKSAFKEEGRVDRGDTGFAGSRVLMTGSGEGGMKYIPFGSTLAELEAPELMRELRFRIMSVFGVTENEFGMAADVNKANGFHLSYTFKNRAVQPILNAVANALTQRLLWEELDLTDLEFRFSSIDTRDDRQQTDIDINQVERGIRAINEVRKDKGWEPIEGGDVPFVYTPTGIVPVSQIQQMFEAQMQPKPAVAPPNQGGTDGSRNLQGSNQPDRQS